MKHLFFKSLFVFILLVSMVIPTNLIEVFATEVNTSDSSSEEENVTFNVYDADSFKKYLQTENADIVLWRDITISDSVEALCNSIDLNGYNLTFSKLTLASDGKSFSFLDSAYNSKNGTSTGAIVINDSLIIGNNNCIIQGVIITVSNGISGDGDLTIQDGIVTVNGKNGTDGVNGRNGQTPNPNNYPYNYDGTNGKNGTNGTSGSTAIYVSNIYIYGGCVFVTGGRGGHGGNGGSGGDGHYGDWEEFDNPRGGEGGSGSNGGNAGSSGNGIYAVNNVIVYSGTLVVSGGSGGNGGKGGNGGNGGKGGDGVMDYNSNHEIGGHGGSGGNAGNAGYNTVGSSAIRAENFIIYSGSVTATGGNGGKQGLGGVGGVGGKGGLSRNGNGYNKSGENGENGEDGFFHGNGGAGIDADFTMYGGEVIAIGGNGAAGIGGPGYVSRVDGHNVNISGGKVVVTAGADAFDIGGGYNGTQIGEGGTLTVTGGTVEFSTYGNATNISSPVFKNCTITGPGAYQHEGTYDQNGKFLIAVQDITILPEECIGYDKVSLQAPIAISRTSNISIPAPRGYISFKLDGTEIGTATIENPIASEGQIIASAAIDWVAVEDRHLITAEYIAGTNDKYASAGVYKLYSNIDKHEHNWDDDFTVDLPASCVTVGQKSIHCKICDSKKDATEIPTTGHFYINNQCVECNASQPLVVFKNHDGTVLSSNYYYIGDTISVPTPPTRNDDNTYTYQFVGWDKEIVKCDGDKEYIAVYEPIYKNYTVTFKNHDGTVISTNTYHYGDTIVVPTAPTKNSDEVYAYTFAGWDSDITACLGNKTYTATFSQTYIYYTVVFKNFDGSVISKETYHYGEAVIAPQNPTKPSDNAYSYQFDGWNTPVVACAGNATYTATYKSVYNNYTITFVDYNGTVLGSANYHYGDAINPIEAPSRAADNVYTYVFAGWDKEIGTCKGNETFTATYTHTYIDYTIIFKNHDGTVISTNTYHYGDSVVTPNDPKKPSDENYCYVFAGWDKSVTNCYGNAEYIAKFTAQELPIVTIGNSSARVNENVVVNLFLAGAPNLKSLTISDLLYDTSAFDLVSVEWKVPGAVISDWDMDTGKGALALSIAKDLNGTILSLTFKVKDGTADGTYPVSCAVTSYECDFKNVAGQITVSSEVLGDINCSGNVDINDALLLFQHIMLPDFYPISYRGNIDFTKDGNVDISDALLLFKHSMLPNLYPIS